jgi:hypothetical protein
MWNLNLSEAPTDRDLWLASKCGKVIKTAWDKKRGQWAGFATNGSAPIAWQVYVVPVHPHHMVPSDLSPVAAKNIPIVDGVGGYAHE